MHRVIHQIWQNRVSSVIISLLILISLPIGFDEFKYFLFALGLFGVTLSSSYRKGFTLGHVLLILILIYSFASQLWAANYIRVIPDSFILLSLSLFTVVISGFVDQEKGKIIRFQRVLVIIFTLLLSIHFLALHLDLAFTRDWHNLLAKNKNYTVSFLSILYPFLLFYNSKSQFVRFSKLVCGFLLLNIIIILGVRGALLGLGILLIFKVFTLWNKRVLFYFLASIALFLGVSIGNDEFKNIASSSKIYQEFIAEYPSRDYLNKTSIDQFLEHPILGVGVGNWVVNAYSRSVDGIRGLDMASQINRLGPHNWYTYLLAEYGVIGIIFWLLFLLIPFWYYYRLGYVERRPINMFLAAWIVYFVLVVFYATSHSSVFFFSGIQVIGFFALGGLLGIGQNMKLPIDGKAVHWLRMIVGGILLLYFTLFAYNRYNIHKWKMSKYEDSTLIDDIPEIYGADTEPYYPIKLSEAIAYEKMRSDDATLNQFNICLHQNPHNVYVLLEYLRFLRDKYPEDSKIETLKQSLLSQQSNLVISEQLE